MFIKKSFIYKGYGNQIQDPLFIAPEFVEKKYNNKVDIWGVGILAYLLFVGKEPFTGNKHEIIYQISNKFCITLFEFIFFKQIVFFFFYGFYYFFLDIFVIFVVSLFVRI